MSLTRDQIKSAALSLAPADREALAEELLLSVADADPASIDAAWLEESRRRDADLAAGRATIKPVQEVLSRLQARIAR